MKRTQCNLGLVSGVVLACTALCASGCAAQQKILGRSVANRQVAIVLHISEEVNAADKAGGAAELVQTITDGLKDHGINSEIYTHPDDHPPPPRIELNVVYWSETNETSRSLRTATAVAWPLGIVGGIVGPDNRMIVDCAVVLGSNGERVLWQRFTAGRSLATNDEASAGGNAGSQILDKILKN